MHSAHEEHKDEMPFLHTIKHIQMVNSFHEEAHPNFENLDVLFHDKFTNPNISHCLDSITKTCPCNIQRFLKF